MGIPRDLQTAEGVSNRQRREGTGTAESLIHNVGRWRERQGCGQGAPIQPVSAPLQAHGACPQGNKCSAQSPSVAAGISAKRRLPRHKPQTAQTHVMYHGTSEFRVSHHISNRSTGVHARKSPSHLTPHPKTHALFPPQISTLDRISRTLYGHAQA